MGPIDVFRRAVRAQRTKILEPVHVEGRIGSTIILQLVLADMSCYTVTSAEQFLLEFAQEWTKVARPEVWLAFAYAMLKLSDSPPDEVKRIDHEVISAVLPRPAQIALSKLTDWDSKETNCDLRTRQPFRHFFRFQMIDPLHSKAVLPSSACVPAIPRAPPREEEEKEALGAREPALEREAALAPTKRRPPRQPRKTHLPAAQETRVKEEPTEEPYEPPLPAGSGRKPRRAFEDEDLQVVDIGFPREEEVRREREQREARERARAREAKRVDERREEANREREEREEAKREEEERRPTERRVLTQEEKKRAQRRRREQGLMRPERKEREDVPAAKQEIRPLQGQRPARPTVEEEEEEEEEAQSGPKSRAKPRKKLAASSSEEEEKSGESTEEEEQEAKPKKRRAKPKKPIDFANEPDARPWPAAATALATPEFAKPYMAKLKKNGPCDVMTPERKELEGRVFYTWPKLKVEPRPKDVGLGVLADENLRPGTCFPIFGEPITAAQQIDRVKQKIAGYLYCQGSRCIDGTPAFHPARGVGSFGLAIAMMINEPGPKRTPNAVFKNNMVIITRPIRKNGELLVYYGSKYERTYEAYKPDPAEEEKAAPKHTTPNELKAYLTEMDAYIRKLDSLLA